MMVITSILERKWEFGIDNTWTKEYRIKHLSLNLDKYIHLCHMLLKKIWKSLHT